jgi:hypothetical protein
LLKDDTARKWTSGALWRVVMAGEEKKPNSQMEVVIALWSKGMCEAR